MAQHDGVIANDDGASIRADINSYIASARSNNSDASTFPASAVQGMSFTQILSATQQLEWKYDGAAWRVTHLINPTTGKKYPADVRAIRGLTLSNNGTDAANDIDIAAGVACADDDGCPMLLDSSITKRLDAAWAVGTNQGGLDTGSIANTTYHVWLIRRSDTGVVDGLFSASASSPTMPANYDQKRRIGSVIRVSSALLGFAQDGDRFVLKAPVVDVSTGSPGTSANLATLTVPDGLKVIAIVRGYLFNAAATAVLVTSPDQTDVAADTNTQHDLTTSSNTELQVSEMQRLTNTSRQIRYRSSVGTITLIQLKTLGWIDRRGQDAA